MSRPSSGPTEDVPFQHFPNPKSWVLPMYATKKSYLDLAFCLAAAMAAGFGAGSGAEEGLTNS